MVEPEKNPASGLNPSKALSASHGWKARPGQRTRAKGRLPQVNYGRDSSPTHAGTPHSTGSPFRRRWHDTLA